MSLSFFFQLVFFKCFLQVEPKTKLAGQEKILFSGFQLQHHKVEYKMVDLRAREYSLMTITLPVFSFKYQRTSELSLWPISFPHLTIPIGCSKTNCKLNTCKIKFLLLQTCFLSVFLFPVNIPTIQFFKQENQTSFCFFPSFISLLPQPISQNF